MTHETRDDALASPELHRLIRLARRNDVPKVRVTADQIFDAFQSRRQARRQRWIHSSLALAALLSVVYLGASVRTSLHDLGGTPATVAASSPIATPAPRAATPALDREHLVAAAELPAPLAPKLLSDALIQVLEPHAAPPEVVGPHAIRLSQGTFSIDLSDPAPLTIYTPEGELEVHAGAFTVAVASAGTEVIVESGAAFWVRDDRREPVRRSAAAEINASRTPARASASELAELAEASLRKGRRSAAIRHLRQLVVAYPRSSEAGRGLLDLGRLERAEGNPDAARCAYQLYLDRSPDGALTGDVERALDRLGPGPRCRGLQPR